MSYRDAAYAKAMLRYKASYASIAIQEAAMRKAASL